MDANHVNNVKLNAAQLQAQQALQTGKNSAVENIRSFGEVLTKAVDESVKLKFSKHAATRLNSREVDLSPEQLKRVEEGVTAAKNKGVYDSLVLVDGYALVVDVRSRMVVTAMKSGESKVYTNIDGAVIV